MIEIIAAIVVGFIIVVIFIALAFHNYNARNELKEVYEGLLKKEKSSKNDEIINKKELAQENFDLRYLLELSRLPNLEQTLLATVDEEARTGIKNIIKKIKEVIPNDKKI